MTTSQAPAVPQSDWPALGRTAVGWGTCLLAACSGGEPLAPGLGRGASTGANVLLVTLDTTRADHLTCFGAQGASTPNLDALAARGVRFSQALTCVPLTTPAHASLLTGLYPPSHGVRNNGEEPLPATCVSLAELLAAQGYDTAAFVSAFVLDRRYGLDQGFAHYDDRLPRREGDTTFGGAQERPGQATTDALLAWIAGREARRPFFAWIHYYDAHDPYRPPAPFDSRFKGREYAGEIAGVDAQLGRVLQALESSGVADNLLIAVVGDHGESLGQHGESTHGRTLYEEVMRVPWILAGPRGKAQTGGRAIERVVSIVDVMPTILDLLDVPFPEDLDGRSALAKPDPDRAVYLETMMPLFNNGWAPLFALRSARAKYIRAPRPEFFQLDQDPFELSDGAGIDSGGARALAGRLEQRLSGWPDPLLLASRGRPLGSQSAQALQALGYTSAPSADGSIGVLDPKDMLPAWEEIEEAIRLRSQAVGADAPRKLASALAHVDRVLARSPRDRAALEQRARILTAQGRLDEAAAALREYTAIRPSSDAFVFLAQLAQARGKPEEVEPLVRAALELEPSHGGAYIALGNYHLERGEFDRAVLQYEAALRLDPARAEGSATARIAAAREAQAASAR